MQTQGRVGTFASGAVAATVGLVAWMHTIAAAPRYSYGYEQDMGGSAFYPLLLGAALIGGFVVPSRASSIGAWLGVPGLVLSPWTAPRGDNDGLWIMIVPFLAVFVLVLIAAASAGRRVRSRLHSDPTRIRANLDVDDNR
jgi:hypothetical protein